MHGKPGGVHATVISSDHDKAVSEELTFKSALLRVRCWQQNGIKAEAERYLLCGISHVSVEALKPTAENFH